MWSAVGGWCAAVSERLCSVEGCGLRSRTKGMCDKHYSRLLRRGTTDDPVRIVRLCSVEECGRLHFGLGLCVLHYSRLRERGTTDDPGQPYTPRNYLIDLGLPRPEIFYNQWVTDADGECVLWGGRIEKNGYGRIQTKGNRHWSTHQLSYWFSNYYYSQRGTSQGQVIQVRHLCHNKPCGRPEHLKTGSRVDNKRDSLPSTCQRGHPLSWVNKRVDGHWVLHCVICDRRARKVWERQYQREYEELIA